MYEHSYCVNEKPVYFFSLGQISCYVIIRKPINYTVAVVLTENHRYSNIKKENLHNLILKIEKRYFHVCVIIIIIIFVYIYLDKYRSIHSDYYCAAVNFSTSTQLLTK